MPTRPNRNSKASVWMVIVVSLALLGAALFIILTDSYPDSHSKWAFGMVGLIAGYWLR